MRTLTLNEIHEVDGGKFKFHFNVFQAVFMVFLGGLTAGPVGIGYAVGTLVATQGVGQLHDMGVQEFNWDPLQ
jgi:hypothetical protein